jgi:hypothetical protein
MQHFSQNNFCSGVSARSAETLKVSSTDPTDKPVLLYGDSHGFIEPIKIIKSDQWHKQHNFSCCLLQDIDWPIINLQWHFYVAQDCHLEGRVVNYKEVPSKCNHYFTHPKSTASLLLANFPPLWCAHFILWNDLLCFKNTFVTCFQLPGDMHEQHHHTTALRTQKVWMTGLNAASFLSILLFPSSLLWCMSPPTESACQQWTKWRRWLTIYCSK